MKASFASRSWSLRGTWGARRNPTGMWGLRGDLVLAITRPPQVVIGVPDTRGSGERLWVRVSQPM